MSPQKSLNKVSSNTKLTRDQIFTLYYHNIFDYPLTLNELTLWKPGKLVSLNKLTLIDYQTDTQFYCLKNRKKIILQRKLNETESKKKLTKALSAAKIFSKIPTISAVVLSGALAMSNAKKESDIDLIIFTKSGTLWSTRFVVYLFAFVNNIRLRKPRSKSEEDRLCLNIWIDAKKLKWVNKNIYTAHEICQLKPLYLKDHIYEKFIFTNKWAKNYWPNAYLDTLGAAKAIRHSTSINIFEVVFTILLKISNKILYRFQYLYMASKISKEKVSVDRAEFHPKDWSKTVSSKLKKKSQLPS